MNEAKEKYKITLIAILLAGACFLTYYFHVVVEHGTVFTHFFYVPIILASIWWKRKGLAVAIFLALLLIFSHFFIRADVETIYDLIRSPMFIIVALTTVILSERIAKAEEMQKEAARYNRGLIESSLDPMVTIDKDGKIMDVNEATIEATGVEREKLIGTKFSEYFTDPVKAQEGVETAFREGSVRDYPLTLQHKSGRTMEVVYNASVYRDIAGNITGVFAAARDVTERKKAEERIEHLNLVLRAIRNVNQLIAKEKDRDRLLKGGCYTLIEARGYYNAWLALIDESGKLVTAAEAGLGEDFLPMVERLKAGELTPCVQKALKQSDVVVTDDPSSTCADCPLAKSYAGRGAMTVQLEHGGKMYGLLSASIPAEFTADEEEQALFKELAGDVAFALHSIELEEARKSAEEKLARQAQELSQEREKLNVILHSTADGILVTDPQNRVMMANPAAEHLLGFSLKEVVGKKLDVTIRDKTLREKIYRTREEARVGYEFELELKDPVTSEPRALSGKTACLKNREGEVIGVVAALSDITKLREVDRMKTEFLSTAAHQIRTPLTSIQGFSEILLTREIGKEETRKFLTYINNQAVGLAAIINDLLDISRIESRRGFQIEKRLNNIQPIIKENVRTFEETSKIHTFKIEAEEEISDISMDRDKISEVMKNLLSNATKYSPQGGEIVISAKRKEKTIEISISDKGIGMTDEQLSHLFEKFYRADASDTAVEGTGLGLCIVKYIIEAHGGDIWVESQYEVGTTVHFTLPVNTNVR